MECKNSTYRLRSQRTTYVIFKQKSGNEEENEIPYHAIRIECAQNCKILMNREIQRMDHNVTN